MTRSIPVFLAAFVFSVAFPLSPQAANVSSVLQGDAIKWRSTVIDVSALKSVYKTKRSGYWTDNRGLNKRGKELIKVLRNAGSDGLEPADYLSALPKKLSKKDLAPAELYLTQSFLRFSRDVFAGRTTPSVTEPDIIISRKKINSQALMKSAFAKGPASTIKSLRPPHRQYDQLRKMLAKTSNKARREKIIVNMERWRWLPRSLGKTHVLVNQAAFNLEMVKSGKLHDQRRVIVGKPFHKTPMFSHKISIAEFNPTWTVPRSIAGNEMLPKLRQDPNYLTKRGYKIHTSWKADAPVMNPNSIDWHAVRSKNFPYKIVQGPGEKNALGQVKFLFPNKFKVYMHDTPGKKLFNQAERAFSHGCIRVEKPLKFAEKLLNLKSSKINSMVKSGETHRIKIRQPIPVHLTYFTVWIERNGKASFHKDIYKRDRLVGNILFGRV